MSLPVLKLQVQNFRRFVDPVEILFQPGLTIISGPNGAGKSTLAEVVVYALFGRRHGRGNHDPHADQTVNDLQVTCELLIDDQWIKICRSSTTVALWVNQTVQVQDIPASVVVANRQIEALLGGLTREQFERTYIALQGDTAGLVEAPAEERRKIIEAILQLEVLTQAVQLQEKRCDEVKRSLLAFSSVICDELGLLETARSLLKNYQDARRSTTRQLSLQQFAAVMESLRSERQHEASQSEAAEIRAQEEVATMEQKLVAQKAVVDRLTWAYHEQEQQYKVSLQVDQQIANVEGQLQQVQEDIEHYQEEMAYAATCTHAVEEYERLQATLQTYERRLERLPLLEHCYRAYQRARTMLLALEHQVEPLLGSEDALRMVHQQEEEARGHWNSVRMTDPTAADVEVWQAQQARLKHEEQHHREALRLLSSGLENARCPTCHQHFTEHTSQQRIEHLSQWLREALPVQREALEQQARQIEQRKKLWLQQQRQAEALWQQQNTAVATTEKQVQRRDLFLQQIEEAQVQLRVAQQEWERLEEQTAPNPQERLMLEKKRLAISRRVDELKQQVDASAQLPLLQMHLEKKRQEQADLLVSREQLQEQYRALGFDDDLFEHIQGELREAQECAATIREELTAARSHAELAHFETLRALQAERQASAYLTRFTEMVSEEQQEEQLASLLKAFMKSFFAANTQAVTQRTSQLLLHAITDHSILGIRFDGSELVYLDASSLPHPVGRLSGGEKALVGLCLRIALAEQAQAITRKGRVKFLILDEVLSSLDEERREAVQRIFEDVLRRGIFEHLIMITHLEPVKQGWRAAGLAVQKTGSKTSTVLSFAANGESLGVEKESGEEALSL